MTSTNNPSFDLPEVFKWRNPIESGLALLSLNLIYISSLIQGAGLIHLVTSYTWWFIVTAAVYLKIRSILSGRSSDSSNQSGKEDDYVFVSDQTCQRIMLFVNDITSYFTQQIKTASRLEHLSSLVKFIAGLYLLALVGLLFSVQTLLWLTLNGLFIHSFINHNEQAKNIVTPLINMASGTIKQYSQLIYAKIPRYTEKN